MESELIGTLEHLVSPTVMQALRRKSAEKAVTKIGQSQLIHTAPLSSGSCSGSRVAESQECVLQAEAQSSGLC